MFVGVFWGRFLFLPPSPLPPSTHLKPFFDLVVGTLSGLDPSKKMRDVRTIILAAVSRRDLRHSSENEGFRV